MPIQYKLAFGILALLAIFGAGYYKGYSSQHDELTSYKAHVAQEAADQAAIAQAKDRQNEENSRNVVQGWKADHDRLMSQLNSMRNSNGGSPLPQAAYGKQGHDDSVAVEGGTCSKAFYGKALEAELMLETWQAWAAGMAVTGSIKIE